MKVNYRQGITLTFSTNMLAAAVGVVTGVLLARLLGPEGRGGLAAIQNWALVFIGVGPLGLTTAVAYFSGREPGKAGAYLATCLVTLLVWSIPLVVLLYTLMPVLLVAQPPDIIWYARSYLVIVPVQFAERS